MICLTRGGNQFINKDKSFHRRRLPHLYFSEGQYFVTYRLANTIAKGSFENLKSNAIKYDFQKFKRLLKKYDRIMKLVDYGVKYLSQNKIIDICKKTLHYPDGKDYRLICYSIMPTHIHLVFELLPKNKGISKIMQSIKGISARECNKALEKSGTFWEDESFDHWIRNDKELFFIIRYTLLNPVKAGLVNDWKDWKHTYCHPDFVVL